jgi:hypothetical protein
MLTARDQLRHWLDCTALPLDQTRLLTALFRRLDQVETVALCAMVDALIEAGESDGGEPCTTTE